jgi:hypothetical protein
VTPDEFGANETTATIEWRALRRVFMTKKFIAFVFSALPFPSRKNFLRRG